jgi:purine nucleosidase/pyrimidine-specific ribonucleoside hydrolase
VSARRVHIDTDPGLDDLLALALAFASPELEVVGITTVAGNASLAAVTENARRFLGLADRDLPLGAGAAGPLALARVDAAQFHGADGRRGLMLAAPPAPRPPACAREVLRASLAEREAECVIALGPLSNVAALLRDEPGLFDSVDLVWMGGTLARGNVTPLAEFNAYADPEALRVVLDSGVRLRVVGLEVTEQVALDEPAIDALGLARSTRGGTIDAALRALCRAERGASQVRVAYLHDPSAIAAAFAPELFDFAPVRLRVHVAEGAERGRLVAAGKRVPAVDYARATRATDLVALFAERVAGWARAGGA